MGRKQCTACEIRSTIRIRERMIEAAPVRSMRSSTRAHGRTGRQTRARITDEGMGPLMAAAHPDAFTLIDRFASVAAARVRPAAQSPRRRPGAHHPRLRRASGAHRIDGVGKPLALALRALLAGNLTFAVEGSSRRLRTRRWRASRRGTLWRVVRARSAMSSIKPLIAAPRNSAPSQATHHADESSPEQRAQEEIAVEDSKQSHEQGEYEHETAPPEHTTYKEKVGGATTAKDLPYAMHVLAPVPRESRGSHMRALTKSGRPKDGEKSVAHPTAVVSSAKVPQKSTRSGPIVGPKRARRDLCNDAKPLDARSTGYRRSALRVQLRPLASRKPR